MRLGVPVRVLATALLWLAGSGRICAEPSAEATPGSTPESTPGVISAPPRAEAREGDVSIVVSVSPEAATVGDPLEYEVVVEAPAGTLLAEPALVADPAPFEFVEAFRLAAEEQGGERVRRTFRARLRVFDTGTIALPELVVDVRSPAGEARLAVPAVAVRIDSVLPAGEDPGLREAKGVVTLPGTLGGWPLALLAGLAVAIVAALLWARRRRLVQAGPGSSPDLPFDEKALRDLKALAGGDLLRRGQVKQFYVVLSEIVRAYLGARYGFDALEMTSDELRLALGARRAEPEARDLSARIGEASDLVKFARHQPPAGQAEEVVASAFRLIEVTRPSTTAPALAEVRR